MNESTCPKCGSGADWVSGHRPDGVACLRNQLAAVTSALGLADELLDDQTNRLVREQHENTRLLGLLGEIRHFMCFVNSVTCPHRHGSTVPERKLTRLANEQIDMEKLLAEFDRITPTEGEKDE